MPLIQWKDELSVGIASIDTQHKRLIDLINQLNDAMLQRKGAEVLKSILEEMTEYTKTHFKTEEIYFERFGYQDAEAHIAGHRAYEAKVAKFIEDQSSGKLGLSLEVMNFLGDWWKNHIKQTDRKYSEIFLQNNVK